MIEIKKRIQIRSFSGQRIRLKGPGYLGPEVPDLQERSAGKI
jgi:hypothetical protein